MEPVVILSKSDSHGFIRRVSRFMEEHGVRTIYSDNNTTSIHVQQNESILRLIDLTSPYLVATLEAAIIMEEEIIPAYRSGVNTSMERFYDLMEIVDYLSELQGSRRERKYTQAYFTELWTDDLAFDDNG
jgi:hypothetical protein